MSKYIDVLNEIEISRKEFKIPRKRLCLVAGIKYKYYCQILKGGNIIAGDKLLRLIEALGYDISFSKRIG